MYINEMFWSYQAEGNYAGYPAFFIRTHGCPVGCAFCDTNSSRRVAASIYDMRNAYNAGRITSSHIVVITGGEPLASEFFPDILDNTRQFKAYDVQLETSGMGVRRESIEALEGQEDTHGFHPMIVLSPKVRTIKHVDVSILKACRVVKLLWHPTIKNHTSDDIRNFYYEMCKESLSCNKSFCIQPMASLIKKNGMAEEHLKEMLDLCQRIGAYLSLQTHKWLKAR